MTEVQVSAGVGVDFVLPGRWWHIALEEDAAVNRQVRSLVRSALGRGDDRAQLRNEMQQAVERAVATARRADASDFYFALEIVPEVPIPATLAVYWPPVPFGLSLDAGARSAAESLASSLTRKDPGCRTEVLGSSDVALLRTEKTIAGEMTSATGVAEARELVVSYWVIRQDADRPLLLSFTTALASLRDEMVELFDAIVSTLDWRVPEAGEEAG